MTISKQPSLVFSNSFGLIFDDRIYLQRENVLSCFYIENLKSVKFTKIQEKKVNIFSLLFSLLTLCFTTLFIQNNFVLITSAYVLAATLLVVSFMFKKHIYVIVVLTNANDFVTIKVNNDLKYAAKEIIKNVNIKLQEKERFLRVG